MHFSGSVASSVHDGRRVVSRDRPGVVHSHRRRGRREHRMGREPKTLGQPVTCDPKVTLDIHRTGWAGDVISVIDRDDIQCDRSVTWSTVGWIGWHPKQLTVKLVSVLWTDDNATGLTISCDKSEVQMYNNGKKSYNQNTRYVWFSHFESLVLYNYHALVLTITCKKINKKQMYHL